MTPEGWVRAPLAKVALHVGRGTTPTYASGNSTFYAINQKCVRHGRVGIEHARPHDPTATIKQESILRSGDVCVNSTGTGTIGRVGLWDMREAPVYFADTHVTVVRPDPAAIVPKFLCEALLSPWMQRELETGCFSGSTNQVELSKGAFLDLGLLLPPLSEQRKIAAILSSVDDAIEATRAVIDQLQVVKKAMMAELLARGLPGRHTRFKQMEIGEVPEEWEVVPLGSLIARGPDNGIYKPQSEYGSGLPILRIDGFDNGDRICRPELRRVNVSAEEVETFGLRANDIVINRVNSLSHLAKTGLVGELDEPTLFESNMMRLAVDSQRMLPAFAFRVVSSKAAKDFFLGRAKQAVAQASINQQDVKALPVRLPPLEEQHTIANALACLDSRMDVEGATYDSLKTVKATLMSVLLSGEVRVTPDEAAA